MIDDLHLQRNGSERVNKTFGGGGKSPTPSAAAVLFIAAPPSIDVVTVVPAVANPHTVDD
jgi:hypothetical protein